MASEEAYVLVVDCLDLDSDIPLTKKQQVLVDRSNAALTAARAEGEAAFRERAIQAAKKLQIGGLNRSVVYNMLNNLEVAAAGSKTKVVSEDEQKNSENQESVK